jgi:hypothetical protein
MTPPRDDPAIEMPLANARFRWKYRGHIPEAWNNCNTLANVWSSSTELSYRYRHEAHSRSQYKALGCRSIRGCLHPLSGHAYQGRIGNTPHTEKS